MRTLPLLLLLAVGCGGSTPPAESPPASAPSEAEAPPAPQQSEPQPGPGQLWRHEVAAVVDAGLGRFLQRVRLEPVVEAGEFRGFRVVELLPAQWWAGVDLQPGDVVTSVNGMPIERDTDAYDAFVALKEAEALSVAFTRDGSPMKLVYAIVDREGAGDGPAQAPVEGPAQAPAQPSGKAP